MGSRAAHVGGYRAIHMKEGVMLFADKKNGRNLSVLFKMSRDEKDFLAAEAKKRGISRTALMRKCLRTCLLEEPSQPVRKRTRNVGNHA